MNVMIKWKYLGFCHLDSLARAAAAHWNKNKIKILSESLLRETIKGKISFLITGTIDRTEMKVASCFGKTLKPWKYNWEHIGLSEKDTVVLKEMWA